MDLNKVQLIWNVTQDIELKQTPNWQNVTSFSVATNRSWVDNNWVKQEQAEFHNIVLWWKLAEISEKFIWKGKKVYIEWRLQTRNWEWDDWKKRYKTEIIWENLIMLSFKNNDSDNNSKKNKKNKDDEISVEDIPF